ncbi:aldo/keto reductase [Taklimakanibacter deserti]|uniref:aldo/keto reductase n=1 Tax=Taklimakanibacter deserti TaxID=2267839 RepID=UPI000E6509D3
MTLRPDRIKLAPDLEISRLLSGLWQIADMEKDGRTLDPAPLAREMKAYAEAGFDTFDMADHYGSAEIIAGHFHDLHRSGEVKSAKPVLATKWCPTPGPMTRDVVRAAVDRARERLRVAKIDLLQFHWWMFQHPGYVDAMKELALLKEEGLIGHLGTTNFDTGHARLLHDHGIPLVTNQVCFSLLDRRAAGDMSAFCVKYGVRLLAYGTLAGGLLTEKWLGKARPRDVADWSTMKYLRFVDQVGGWDVLQAILTVAAKVAQRHGVSIGNVATRWVLEQKAVAGVIIGARLGEREHRADNLKVFGFALDQQDHRLLEDALAQSTPLPGDCGDEYRKPPFLTASGDLSHHLKAFPKVYQAQPMPARPARRRIDTGSIWEPLAGYSRAVRIGERILVSGTTATHGAGEVIAPGSPASQTVYILDKVRASIEALGAEMEDVVRTRVYLRDRNDWEEVSKAHGRVFGDIRPANTLLEASGLIGDYAVEIEAEAIVER